MDAIFAILLSMMDSHKFKERECAEKITTIIVIFTDRYELILDQSEKHSSPEVRRRCRAIFASYYKSLFNRKRPPLTVYDFDQMNRAICIATGWGEITLEKPCKEAIKVANILLQLPGGDREPLLNGYHLYLELLFKNRKPGAEIRREVKEAEICREVKEAESKD